MIRSLLIANRGEIACRIIRTCHAMGVRTVAVYSDADAKALHVRQADTALHIGGSPARESYLRGDRIIAAALESGAEAIHPGYGFLSENADFAQSVIDAGLVWVGPSPHSIRAMGLKDAAKARMIAAGVPVTPGYLGADQSPDRLAEEAAAIGYPVLLKAVAGGGGKGMRRVDDPADFADALVSCQREAASSFGDDRVLIEKYILSPRHIEVQVFGDTHGNVVHLFERDCSLQRRHQKVIEEAPAPGMDPVTREAICAAAVKAARAVDYVGAGTIEFIADASEGLRADRIWFMEMNTRLQVEHPVTEEITGVDLVEWQLRVASGEALPKRQDELSINGWAMEARLYAEDPAKGFLPSIGKIDILRPDPAARFETGVSEGAEITGYYDPMIAKIIVHQPDRDSACEWLAAACARSRIYPLKTNAAFLMYALEDADFRAGRIDTGFIANKGDALLPPSPSATLLDQAAVAVLVQEYYGRPRHLFAIPDDHLDDRQADPWRAALNFRLNACARRDVAISVDGVTHSVVLPRNWRQLEVFAEPVSGGVAVFDEGISIFASPARATGAAAGTAADGAIRSPMPGRIIAVEVAAGNTVTKGQKLVTLEAMKMEHSLVAPFGGSVAELAAEVGAQVGEGAVLARIARADG